MDENMMDDGLKERERKLLQKVDIHEKLTKNTRTKLTKLEEKICQMKRRNEDLIFDHKDIIEMEEKNFVEMVGPSDDVNDGEVWEENETHSETMGKYSILNDFGEKDEESGFSFFEKLRENMTDISPDNDGKIMKEVMNEGVGDLIKSGCIVKFHLNAYHESNDEPYDSTYLRRKPYEISVDDIQLIGLRFVLLSMKKNENAKCIVNSEFCYGKVGCEPRVPKEADILFVINILNVVLPKKSKEFDELNEEKKKELKFDQLISIVQELLSMGKHYFMGEQFYDSLRVYKKVLSILERIKVFSKEEEIVVESLIRRVSMNLSICAFKLRRYPLSISFAKKSAHWELNNLYDAQNYIKKAEILSPNNKDVFVLLNKIKETTLDNKKKETELCRKMMRLYEDTPNMNKCTETKLKENSNEVSLSFKNDVKETMEILIENKMTSQNIFIPLNDSNEYNYLMKLLENTSELKNMKLSIESTNGGIILRTDE
ncbi:hypothetical protein SNEBB_003608 [Seison nebaliae]|nr:hypothetical protein SNEBB_003608 [Seison nebaliae]